MKTLKTFASALAVVFFSGCASIVSGQNQSLSLIANGDSGGVLGARCSLANDKGQWFTTTPGSVTVRRSFSDLSVSCQHPSSAGVAQVKSATKGMAFGNILFGGVIGVGVDVATGAAYDYPDLINVQMTSYAPMQSIPPIAAPLLVPAPATAIMQTTFVEPIKTVAAVPSGADSYQVERMSAIKACHATPRAVLSAKGPGFESYTVGCANGDALLVRCEYGQCRVMR